jgi:hypothetical protein
MDRGAQPGTCITAKHTTTTQQEKKRKKKKKKQTNQTHEQQKKQTGFGGGGGGAWFPLAQPQLRQGIPLHTKPLTPASNCWQGATYSWT